jgi:hypothetical protein
MRSEIHEVHSRVYRGCLGIVDLDTAGYIVLNVTVRVTASTAQAREERNHERIYWEINT